MSNKIVSLPSRGDDSNAPTQIVADNLAAELARRRMSGRQAAAAMGLSVAYVARRIAGDTALDVNDLFAFANMLEVDVSVLLAGANPTPPAPKFRFIDGEGFDANLRPSDYMGADSAVVVDLAERRLKKRA